MTVEQIEMVEEQSKENEEKKPPPSAEAQRITSQAHEVFQNNGCRWDTYFYKVVLAGNVKVIKEVVSHMDSHGLTLTLDWLFQRKKYEDHRYHKKMTSRRVFIMRIVMFVIFTLSNVILTPFFYMLHGISASILNRKQRRISSNIQLPLAYAAFSQNKEMVNFFLSQGADIDHVDRRGNNVFHYIADLSSEASDTAIQIFRNMVQEMAEELECMETMLIQDRNSAGLTAVEYATKFGSPALLCRILKQPNLMHHTPFAANSNNVKFSASDSHSVLDPADQEADTRMELVDVTMYEAGSMADQSTLLNILSDRNIANMSAESLKIFSDDEFVGEWLRLKCKQLIAGVAFLHLCDVLLTCCLVYVLSTSFIGENGVSFNTWKILEDNHIQREELTQWSKNKSHIFKTEAFHGMMNARSLHLQHIWMQNLWNEDPAKVNKLINATGIELPAGIYSPHFVNLTIETLDIKARKPNISFENFSKEDMDMIYEQAIKMPELNDNATALRVARSFSSIVAKFARQLVIGKLDAITGLDNVFNNFKLVEEVYEQLSYTSDDGEELYPSKYPYYPAQIFFNNLLCAPMVGFQYDDFRIQLRRSEYEDLRQRVQNDSCFYQLFLEIREEKLCSDSKINTLLNILFDDTHEYDTTSVQQFVVTCAYMYILIDMLERGVFLTRAVVYQTNPLDMSSTALGQKVPGSYLRKQLNVLSCIAVIFQFHYRNYFQGKWDFYDRSLNEFYENENIVSMVFVIAIVVRFIMHIHSLRLLPDIGHFVITTFMMGTNLLHFSAVFGIVVIIFSTLFHILIDNPECPLEKHPGFVTFMDSVFSTFQLTFGHGELDPYFRSAPVKLTYVLYVIIVGLLLLNLIIAIMTTTATEIMAEPWREVLWKIEWLDEATSAEFSFSVLTLPLRNYLRPKLGYIFHQKAGYVVRKTSNDKKFKIYIECFHCPALHNPQ